MSYLKFLSALKNYCEEKLDKLKLLKKNSNSLAQNSNGYKLQSIELNCMSFAEFTSRIEGMIGWINPRSTSNLYGLMIEYMNICKIIITEPEAKILSKVLKNSKNNVVEIDEIVSTLNEWYQKCHSQQDISTKLIKTITEYEKIKQGLLPYDDKTAIDDLIFSLRAHLNKISNKPSLSPKFEEKCIIGIKEIFKHYSKQQFMTGKNPTFEKIQKNLETLNLGKFTKFCKDFEIFSGPRTEKNTQNKKKIIQKVFEKNSDFNKEMHEYQFIQSFNLLSEYYMDEAYDIKHSTNWKDLPQDHKKIKMFEVLGFHDSAVYSKKMKDDVPHFGKEQSTRIPDNDPSKNYKYNPSKYKQLRMNVEEWKAKRKQEAYSTNHSKNSSLKPSPKIEEGQNFPVKVLNSPKIIKFTPNQTLKYSNFKRKSIITQSTGPSTRKIETNGSITLQKINEMKPEDLLSGENNFNIKDLVYSSDEDEVFSNFIKQNSIPALRKNSKNISERTLERGKELDSHYKKLESAKIDKI